MGITISVVGVKKKFGNSYTKTKQIPNDQR